MAENCVIAVVMGSKSDEAFMQPAFELLDEFGIAWEKRAISAHRQAEELHDYISTAEHNGVKVFIAAAGLSAALPGVIASKTLLPVIGIPVPGGPLKGIDALLSIAQMPGGVPVAAVGIGSQGPKNAALLAMQILSLDDSKLRGKLERFREELKNT